jgi:tetratricopeptide (TPR) repeat protein
MPPALSNTFVRDWFYTDEMMTTGALFLLFMLAPADDYLADGIKALDANQPAAAEPLLRKAVETSPTDVQAQFNLALVLGMEGKDSEAIAGYRKTLELSPALYEADLNLGILLLRNKQSADATIVLKEAATLKLHEFRPQVYYAQSLFETADFEQAEKKYRDAAEIDGKSGPASLGIARSLLKQGKLAESEPYYRTAASLDPAYKNAILELGSEFDKSGQGAEAIAIFKEFPSNPAVTARLTQLLLDSNNALAAIPNLEAAVKRLPNTANRLALIDAYKQTGQTTKVLEQLRLATALDGDNFDLRMSYGRALRDKRLFPEAVRQFQAAATLKPDSVTAWNDLAGALIVESQFDEGLAALDHVKALGKEIPGDLYLRAITLDKMHRKQPAVDAYKQFLSVAGGKYPDEEFLSRQRVRIIENELKR